MSGKSSRINSNGIIILSSHIEQERPVRHVAVQGGWTAAGERWDWPALLAHNNIHQGSGIRMQVRTIGSGLGCAGCARGARDVAEVSSWVATWLLRCFSSWFRFKKKKKHLNAFAGQPVDKWDPTAIQSMAWSRMERRVAIIWFASTKRASVSFRMWIKPSARRISRVKSAQSMV